MADRRDAEEDDASKKFSQMVEAQTTLVEMFGQMVVVLRVQTTLTMEKGRKLRLKIQGLQTNPYSYLKKNLNKLSQ